MNSNESDLKKEKFENNIENRTFKPNTALLTKEKYVSLMIDVKEK